MRWLGQPPRGGVPPNEVILELAFWIGPTPGVAPDAALRDRYRDMSHPDSPGTRDRWIVFHFHIPVDSNTFYNTPAALYMGVGVVGVYHSQGIYRAQSNIDYRAEYRCEISINKASTLVTNDIVTEL